MWGGGRCQPDLPRPSRHRAGFGRFSVGGEQPLSSLPPPFCEASVFCVSLDPKTNTLAVTGGEDDKAFVWRLSDGELLFECSGEELGPGSPPPGSGLPT